MNAQQSEKLRRDIIDTSRAMNAAGINQGTSGNVSARLKDRVFITASCITYDRMELEHVVEMDLEGGYFGDFLPSSEWRMHLDIFRDRAEAGAVVHVHSPCATALSCLRREVPAFHYMIAAAGGGTLRCAEYATFGTAELSQNMLVALEGRSACLLANHGQICLGASLENALALAIEVEALSQQYLLACQAGDPVILDDAEMNRVLVLFNGYGKQPGELAAGEQPAFVPPERRD